MSGKATGKKKANANSAAGNGTADKAPQFGIIKTKNDLKSFLLVVRDKMIEDASTSIYVTAAMNYVLNIEDIYDLLNNENKELARDIWLRLKQNGLQLKNPPLLFSPEEAEVMAG